MTEKKQRFRMDDVSDIIEFDYNTNEYIQDFMWADGKSWDKICNRLNELYEENEQLKHTVHKYSLQIITQDNKIIELEKENKQLIKMLNNVANYMQKEHKEIPVNQFVDWWNNIATMGLKE